MFLETSEQTDLRSSSFNVEQAPGMPEQEAPESARVLARKQQLEKLGFSFTPAERLLDLDDIVQRQETLYRPATLEKAKVEQVGELKSISRSEAVRMEIGEQNVDDVSANKEGAQGPAAEIKGGVRVQKLRTTLRNADNAIIQQTDQIWTYERLLIRDNADRRITEKHRQVKGLNYHGEVLSLYGKNGELEGIVVTMPIPGSKTANTETEYSIGEAGEFVKLEQRQVDFQGKLIKDPASI